MAVGLPSAAFILSLLGTRQGLLLDADSASYLLAADQLRADPASLFGAQDLSSISANGRFPPLYAVVVAIAGDQAWPLRLFTALIASLTVALVGILVRRAATEWAAASAMLAVIVSRGFSLQFFGFLMSDGLNLCLVVAGLVLLDGVVTSSDADRRRKVAVLCLVGGLTMLTRYAGIALLIAVAMALAMLRPWVRWPRTVITVVGTSMAPLAAWMLVQGTGDGVANRTAGWYGPPSLFLSDLSWTLTMFMLPGPLADLTKRDSLGAIAALVLVVAAVALVVRHFQRSAASESTATDRLMVILGCFVVAQFTVVIASAMLIDPYVTFSARHLLPAWVAGVAMCAVAIDGWWHAPRTPPIARRVAGAAAATLLACSSLITVMDLRSPLDSYRTIRWEQDHSSTFAAAVQLPTDAVIITNRGDLLRALDGRRSLPMPLPIDPPTGAPNESFYDEVEEMAKQANNDDAAVVVFLSDPAWSVPIDDLEDVGLVVESRFDDGVILRCGDGCPTM